VRILGEAERTRAEILSCDQDVSFSSFRPLNWTKSHASFKQKFIDNSKAADAKYTEGRLVSLVEKDSFPLTNNVFFNT